ncbi:MAG: UvrD-helicase domain-containing protein, partial [Oscillospiraceae bacterium]|nr:UvrD-helicase domain-containing protein [Oscillospiraceae bacterium]
GLNPAQREAVLQMDGPLLVLAGAGSGKTTVLTRRIAHIVNQGVPPWGILAITFTNKAAKELKTRLASLLGPVGLQVWASTFHAACVRILRRDIDRIGYDKAFTIYDSDDSARVMKGVLRDTGLDDSGIKHKSALSAISAAKDKMISPKQYAAEARGDRYYQNIAKAYSAYQKRLKEANALDFDDLIYCAVTLLESEAEVRDYYQDKFHYVLVDEYQDTNRAQYKLTALMAGWRRNICVVGDDDQSIYRFRGATIENILGFTKQYPDARLVRLEENYRSTGHILGAANALIRHNESRHGKTLWTHAPPGDPVILYRAETDGGEAAYVAGCIQKAHAAGRAYRDFCVLYRLNALSNRLEDTFRKHRIPHRIVGGIRFYERAEIKDVMAYLSLIENRDDTLRLRRIISVPTRNIGERTIEKAAYLAWRDGKPLFDVLREAAEYPDLSRAAPALSAFTRLIDQLGVAAGGMELPDFYDYMLQKTGYLGMLERKIKERDNESQSRLENVLELKSSIIAYANSAAEAGEVVSLSGFLGSVALATDFDSDNGEDDAVLLMTIHTAKGLEFETVYVVGAEENLFPGYRSIGRQEEIEEERRLCYVAITRAREQLHITSASTRMLFGQTQYNPWSRFIGELPQRDTTTGDITALAMAYTAKATAATTAKATAATAPRTAASTASTATTSAAKPHRVAPKPPATKASKAINPARAGRAEPKPSFTLAPGQVIDHKAFGRGLVLSVQPMGGDALVEIAFDTVGTKRMMLKSTAAHMRHVGP